MVDKIDPDVPNDDSEDISEEESAALNDRSTVSQARREEDARFDEKPEPKVEAKPKKEEAEDKKEPKADDEEDDKHPVPYRAMKEERERRKELERRLQEESEKRAGLDAKLNLILNRASQPAEQPKPIDINVDPIAVLDETRQAVHNLTAAHHQAAREQQFVNHAAAVTQQFVQQTPDYNAAYTHAVQTRVAELRALGWSDTDIPQVIQRDEMAIAQRALQMGRNPGEMIYAYAKARGYKKADPKPDPAPEATADEKLATIERGQQASRSLSGNGSAPPAKLTLKDLDQLSEEQIANMPEKDFRALFG